MANRYWVGGAGTWNGTAGTKWATTSGGAGGSAIPTTSDDVFLDAASGAVTVTVSTGNTGCLSLDCTGFTGTLAGTGSLTIAGSLTLVAAMTRTYTGGLTFSSTSTGITITLGGKTTASNVTFNGVGGVWTVQDNWDAGTSTTANVITVTNGTLDFNGKLTSCTGIVSSNSNTRTITMGATTSNLTGTTPINFTTATGLTFNANTSTLTCTSNGTLNFSGGAQTFYNVTCGGGTFTGAMTGANTFNNLTLTGSASIDCSMSLTADITITGTFTSNGNGAGTQRILINQQTPGAGTGIRTGTTVTITAGSTTLTNTDFRDIVGAGAAAWTGTSLGDAQGCSGITFTSSVTRYWVGGTGSWASASEWSTSSGGGGGASIPLLQDTAVFDANSFTGAGQTLTLNGARYTSLDFTNATNDPTLSRSTGDFYGSLILKSGMAFSSAVTLAGQGSFSLNLVGVTIAPLAVAVGNGTIQCLSNIVSSGSFTLYSGTFDANNFNITASTFSSSSSRTRALTFGSSSFTVTGTGTVWSCGVVINFTLNGGTGNIIINDASATGKAFDGGGLVYNNIQCTGAGSGTFTITDSNTFNTFTVDTPPHTVIFEAASTQTITTFSVNGTAGNLMTLGSTSATNFTLSKSTGVVSGVYLSIANSTVGGGSTWYAGANSTDAGGGNIGWRFHAPDNGHNFAMVV